MGRAGDEPLHVTTKGRGPWRANICCKGLMVPKGAKNSHKENRLMPRPGIDQMGKKISHRSVAQNT